MTRHKGLLTGIIIGLIALSTFLTLIGALIAHEVALNTSNFVGDIFQIDSKISKHLTTDLIFLGLTGIGFCLTLWTIKNQTISFAILLTFMTAIFLFGSDLLLQIDAIRTEKFDAQWGMIIYEKLTWTSISYPIIGLIYDRKRK